MSNEAGLLSSLSCGLLTPTNTPELTPGPATSVSPMFIKELLKLFMQTYMDIVKNPVQV